MTRELPTRPTSMMREKNRGTSQASVRKGCCIPSSSPPPPPPLPSLSSDTFTSEPLPHDRRCVAFQSSSEEVEENIAAAENSGLFSMTAVVIE